MRERVQLDSKRASRSKLPTALLLGALVLSAGTIPREAVAEDDYLPHTTSEWLNPAGAARRLGSATGPTLPLEIAAERRPLVFAERPTVLQAAEVGGRGATGLQPNNAPVSWGEPKSYLRPALEIVGCQVGLNLADRAIYGGCLV